ncbi:MAG TPA: diguanylate cyclase [Candidatus Competibacteraceae bacterium]|nr:diguanylate cyclase [Candidatus Competibacteraceae bacterium]HRZ05426.1 diguanylate cyclase [Candidatus Competibacteraceae bacterium]HSA44913.1 diguanylate cyclase [Candidatus Competibacteraceae bacterium]
MPPYTINDLEHADIDHAIQIADRVWWVGHCQENDIFQCHVYLIEQGDQSVLLDPGSVLTFRYTLRKIEEVIPFTQIRYFVCHHQDPDITSALPLIDQLISRDDAVLVTHWRTRMLVKHYGLRLPFWLVEENDWKLALDDRCLDFVFTPYAHFPGAICTFDPVSQVLFSSDLFGGLTPEFSLVAKDESYFEAMRPFHEHYMPSRDILGYALRAIERHPVRIIAPQHGSIIPERLVGFMIDHLKTLDCGLYLIARGDTDIQKLSQLNQTLRDITNTMLIYRDFRDIANSLLEITQRVLPATSLEFHARLDEQRVLHLSPESRYRGIEEAEPPAAVARILDLDHKQWSELNAVNAAEFLLAGDSDSLILMLPLFSPAKGTAEAVAIIHLAEPTTANDALHQIIEQMSVPLQVAVEREVIYRQMDLERQQIYERSIRDPLTGLFTRIYMQEVVQRLCDIQDRSPGHRVAVLMLDIDHFKNVNDTYGHNQGDIVLRRVAAEILATARSSDIAVRLGGEEFAIFVVGEAVVNVPQFAERLREKVAALRFEAPMADRLITVSIGAAIRQPQETLLDLIQRADTALYAAKHRGRNRVCVAPEVVDSLLAA